MSGRLQLSISASNLPNISRFLQKSDPFAIVTVRGDNKDNPPTVIGQTEVAYDDLSPKWATVIILEDYRFGVPLFIEVGVFDFQHRLTGKKQSELVMKGCAANRAIAGDVTDTDVLVGLKLGNFDHKVMGTALFEVGEVIGSRGNVASKALNFKAQGAVVTVCIERSQQDVDMGSIRFQLRGKDLRNKSTLMGKSSPFFEIYRRVERPTGASWTSVFRSNVVRSNLNPIWEAAITEMETFCNADLDRIIKIVVYDRRRGGSTKIIGEVETSVRNFIEAKNAHLALPLSGKDGKEHGSIEVVQAEIMGGSTNGKPKKPRKTSSGREVRAPSHPKVARRPEFVDYLSGGCQISLAVAIDFTASNGDPGIEGTPHYFHPDSPNTWNDYEKAIFAVGTILAKYDSNQMFPVWGFGAKYDSVVRHCFQCGDDVEVHGVNGILEAYRGVFQTPLTMSFPTDFTEVIHTAALYANHEQSEAQEEGKNSYTILLLLTAGNIENVRETKMELNDASSAPLSVVIVGIGDEDFSRMEFLDDHDPTIDAGRDITNFVRFNDFRSFNALTEAVLDEIPDQVVQYFYDRGIKPGRKEEARMDQVVVQPADDDERTVTFLPEASPMGSF